MKAHADKPHRFEPVRWSLSTVVRGVRVLGEAVYWRVPLLTLAALWSVVIR